MNRQDEDFDVVPEKVESFDPSLYLGPEETGPLSLLYLGSSIGALMLFGVGFLSNLYSVIKKLRAPKGIIKPVKKADRKKKNR